MEIQGKVIAVLPERSGVEISDLCNRNTRAISKKDGF